MHDEESGSRRQILSSWDVAALFIELAKDILVSFVKFLDVLSDMSLHQASVVEDKQLFHEDVVRTIETIVEGE